MMVGDKVTIHVSSGLSGDRPVEVTTIVEVGKRALKTADGRRWQTRGTSRRECDAKGSPFGTCMISPYRKDDEARVERQRLLDGARRLLRGYAWEVDRDFDLLSDEDLFTLAEISKRLDEARAKRKAGGT